MKQSANSLDHSTALQGHERVVDFDEVILAIIFQFECIKLELDDIVGVCSENPLGVGVWGIGTIREVNGLDLICLTGGCMD